MIENEVLRQHQGDPNANHFPFTQSYDRIAGRQHR